LPKLSKTWAISKGRTEFENELVEIRNLIARKKIKVGMSKTFLVSEAARAQEGVATGHTPGKIVLKVADGRK
jgi:NADPH:quinone reductase-like Zn-dependent oxidoreductase